MTRFVAQGRLEFEAHDIDDAMARLAQHFAFQVAQSEDAFGEWRECAVCGDDWRPREVEMLDGTDFAIDPSEEGNA